MTEAHVLGTPLMVIDYDGLKAKCQEWARTDQCVALEFTNTQIVTMRRHEADFREVSSACDHFAPDGMPLIWCLNRAGSTLTDRVYGPTFMREFLTDASGEYTHYLLGGSELCSQKLRERFLQINPRLKFVGGFHGKCDRNGRLEGDAETAVVDEINRLSPDFIWVGFGTPKQQAWIRTHKPLLRRGVLLSIGFAFDVNAGMKPDAPLWMQQRGLTWVFRLCSEPRRLFGRYLRYNLLFLSYLALDGLRGRAWGRLA